jgi:GNAT superfamily N-acetyltransferase
MSQSTEILLVQPPVQHPACFAYAVLKAAKALQAAGRDPVLFHAGADFAVNYLMADPVRARLIERVRERRRSGAYEGIEDRGPQWAVCLAEGHDPSDGILGADARALVDTAACNDPLRFAQTMRRLDEALRLASAAFLPARLDRRGFSHPGLDDPSDLADYLDDPGQNPILEYARHGCRPPVPIEACAGAVLIAATPGQLAGALTLGRCWQRRFPSLKLAICTVPPGLQAAVGPLLEGMDRPAEWEAARIVQQAVATAGEADMENGGEAEGQLPIGRTIRRCPLQPENFEAFPVPWADDPSRVIVWERPRGTSVSITRLLFQAAKEGCWNHLALCERDDPALVGQLRRLADENPYIVHSWCRRDAPVSNYSDATARYPEGSPAYGRTVPLPGRPLWQQLQDPVFLQPCVAAYGAKAVARQRLVDDGRGIAVLGRRLIYHYLPPGDLPPGGFDEICRMVEAGGTVGSKWLRHNLERAYLIGYAEENGIIAGNSSLKHPREEYLDAVSAQCGIDLHDYLERGYTSVRPEYRGMGVGARLLEGLTARAGKYKVYSVIAEDNVATQKMAIRNRTRRVASFYSQRTHKRIGIWIPEWMLPEGVQLSRQPDLK